MLRTSLIILAAIAGYLLLWPVPVAPVSWNAPINAGYVGDFEQNTELEKIETWCVRRAARTLVYAHAAFARNTRVQTKTIASIIILLSS